MIGLLLVWLIGAAAMVYEITAHVMWRDVLAAMLGAGLMLWTVGGAALLSLRSSGRVPRSSGAMSPEVAKRLADLQRENREVRPQAVK